MLGLFLKESAVSLMAPPFEISTTTHRVLISPPPRQHLPLYHCIAWRVAILTGALMVNVAPFPGLAGCLCVFGEMTIQVLCKLGYLFFLFVSGL